MTKKATPIVDDSQWAGTDTSLVMYLNMLQQDEERMQAGISYARDGVQRPELPYLLEVSDNVGIITIKGPMSNRTGYYDEYDKRATYPAIREALVTAAAHPDVKHILLDIDSGGGGVAGVADVGNLIREVNTKVKPVTAFTDGNMMSAAYWLGSAAGKVYASKVAGVGSIGVIATHAEMSKMYKEMGITLTVMRAGKYKALANSAEPLTEAAKEQMQAGLDATYGVFVQHVADMRGTTYNDADKTMAQGREFYGEAAVKAGLVDGIETFDSLMSKLSVDKRHSSSQNSQNATTGTIMKKALTDQDIAAIASGVQIVASTEGEQAKDPAQAEGEKAPEAATPTEGEKAPEGEGEKAPEAAAAAQGVVQEAGVVTFLQAQIKDKDAALLQANIELNAAKAKITDFEASMTGLLEIAAKSTNNMRIALGGSAMDMSAMSAAQVLAEHGSVSEQFKSKFVAGGVAAVDAAQSASKKGEKQPVDALTRARLSAVRATTRK